MSRPFSDEDVFRAVAHPARRSVLDLLRDGERTAGQIAEALRRTASVLSEHLRILRTTGLVIEKRRGPHRFYRLNDHRLAVVKQWSAECRCKVPRKRAKGGTPVTPAAASDRQSDAALAFSNSAAKGSSGTPRACSESQTHDVGETATSGRRETAHLDASPPPHREPGGRSPPA